MSYSESVEFWKKWASVPLQIAVPLVLGHNPEEYEAWDSSEFKLLYALALNAGIAEKTHRFAAPNNSEKWTDDPTVYLEPFGKWAASIGYQIRAEYPGAQTAQFEIGSPEWRSENARHAANARHDRPGESRSKQQIIREIWATGKYSSRDRCAEEECWSLGISYSTARKALRNTPDPE